jgi:hypothetical protein
MVRESRVGDLKVTRRVDLLLLVGLFAMLAALLVAGAKLTGLTPVLSNTTISPSRIAFLARDMLARGARSDLKRLEITGL